MSPSSLPPLDCADPAPGATLAQLQAQLAHTQEQMRAMAQAHEAFMGAVSHDLRAPLRHVTSYGALVREVLGDLPTAVVAGPQVQEALAFLSTMDHSARRMAQMIDGLQAVWRASRAPLRAQPVPLASALREVCSRLAQAQGDRRVDWQLPESAPDTAPLPLLQADAELLQEFLQQLLGNAVKFTRGQPAATIAVQPVAAEPGWVGFAVIDNGAGFDPARAGQLFGMFQRLHRDKEFEGVGAGLALCQTIAQRHGARVSATAAVGQGCTVQVLWPAAQGFS